MPVAPPASEHKKPPAANDTAKKPSQAAEKAAGPVSDKAAAANKSSSGGQQRFDRMAVRAKLAVSEPGDRVEREADAVADKVMRMQEPASTPAKGKGAAPAKPEDVKRKEEPKGKADVKDSKATPGKTAAAGPVKADNGPSAATQKSTREKIVRKEESSPAKGDSHQDSAHSSADRPGTTQELIERLGPGELLDGDVRAYFEKRMGFDLSNVRIHTNAAAAQSAAQIQARAFTYGNHIAFAKGEYQPQSESGKHLLAHELAHVMQQSEGSISRMIMRIPASGSGAASSSDFEVTHAVLEVPPIKARHTGGYGTLADKGGLKRKGAYDASTRGTRQIKEWTDNVKPDINKIPAARRPSAGAGFNLSLDVAGGASAKVIKSGSLEELTRLLQIPTWDAAGNEVQFQVDHMVEYQLGGADVIDNMELLNQAHNGSVGSSFSHGIKRTVREEIQADPTKPALAGYSGARNAAGDPTAEGVMEAMTVVFRKVKGRARESGRKEGGSIFWSKEQINALDHVLPLLGGAGSLEGTATRFALLSPTGNLLIAQFQHTGNIISIGENQAGGMAGFTMKRLVLNPGYNDAAAGGNIGSLEGVLNFGPAVAIPPGNVRVEVSQAQSPGKYSGKLGVPTGPGLPNQVDFKPMSPLQLSGLSFGKGVFGKAMLQPSHPALSGLSIPAQIQDGKLGLFHTIDATQIGQKLKIPGVKVESAGITLGYDGTDFSVAGGTEFTIQKFGSGFLNASIDTSRNFELNGGFRADKRLFDQADMKLWYRSKGGFGGSGTLGITQPGKVKGIKSAALNAKYEDSVFTATGNVVPDIPGLKAASLSVRYEKDELVISGNLGMDDKVPGVEKADITVTVTQGDKDWKVAASGDVTPRLPGLSGAKLKFIYDDGSVLVEGEFSVKKGPLDGKVKAGVTNAAVDDKGVRSEKGEGKHFKVFGAADIKAEFIKDKLDGTLKLRLLPDGSVRVGGGLTTKDFDVFDKYPKDGGEFFNKTFSTPPVPLPGLGFAVGSISVGITFSASVTAKAHASIGPGKLSSITLEIKEFDPANVDYNTLEIGGGGTFAVYADAGFGADARINLIFGAAVAELVGSVGAAATVGIPADKPILSAKSDFTYSQAKGLDINNTLKLDISPELKFRLFGEVSARLNIVVDTITVWKKDWTLAEASYKLPVGITATGQLGYNSKSGKITPDKPADAIKIEQPKLDGDAMKGVVMGDSAPPAIKTLDKENKEITDTNALMCSAPVSSQASLPQQTLMPNQSVMPKQRSGAEAPPPAGVDEGIVGRLGTGVALDLSTRGYFEQRMKADLSRVQLHINPGAAREADKLSAKAFTVGNHIAFAQGEYQPNTPEGQELIAHELAHVAQQQGGSSEPILLRWPAVTRTSAQTSETPASVRAMSLSGFSLLTKSQLDWATSPALQADAAALMSFRDIERFTERPNVLNGAGSLNVGDVIAQGIPGIYAPLEKYAEGAATRNTAWLRSTGDIGKAVSWGRDLTRLEAAWPAANLSLVMRAPPDPAATPAPFEKLVDPAKPELTNFINYLTTCTPVLSAGDGSEVDSFIALRGEGALPHGYHGKIHYAKTYHHFTKNTLDGLVNNEAFPQWKQQWAWFQRPLTVVLYPAIDDNHAFHRNAGLEAMVTNTDMLTIVIEGHASVADYQTELAPVASRYGINGEIAQAMVGGHGNSTVLNLAGSANASVTVDALGTSGTSGATTTGLMTELTRLMNTNPAQRRIVLDACLTNSHHVASALRATPADAAADVNAAITADPSLRDVVAGIAGAGSTVLGANASFAPSQTTFMTPGTTNIGVSVPDDPDLVAGKLTYVEFGTEPAGCMRAVLECWAADQLAGTHACRDAMRRRIGAGRSTHVPAVSTDTWRESIIQPIYDLAANQYWGNGDAIRQLGDLADRVFVLYMVNHTTPGQINSALSVIAGNVAQINQLFTRVTAESTSTSSMRVAITLEQVWMQYNTARRGQFMTELARYGSCALASTDLDMNLVMPHVTDLLVLPPVAAQRQLALLAARHAPLTAPAPIPAHIAYLRGLLGAGPTFPAAAGISAALGTFASEEEILADIGRPLAGGKDPSGPPPAANIDTERDVTARNDFRVTPLRAKGTVATVRDDLMVRSTPTTTTNANIFNRLSTGSSVFIVGEYGIWYAIEQPGRTGFVAKRYITRLP